LIAPVRWETVVQERLTDLCSGRRTNVVYELEVCCRDESRLQLYWHNTLIHHRELGEQVVLAVAIDITARKKAEEKTLWLASHDTLTGLYNRWRFTQELSQVLERNLRTGAVSAVMFLDLDLFKDINDTSGHHTGDLLLKRIAQRLLEVVRPGDRVARLDGDEFAIIANDVDPEHL